MANFTPQEIEEMLQEFFDTVGKRQYIGARYVPIFGRRGESSIDWDNSGAYEPLSIVYYLGDTYTSRQYVPAGIDISDTNYWVVTGRYNAQVEQYRQEVRSFDQRITANTNAIADESDARENADQQIRDDVADDYVPFPDGITWPKFGTLGQVLSTLANGDTKWQDPVVPSDAQAEAIITQWLDDHPEATTTVQDGSITWAKLASSLIARLVTSSHGHIQSNNYQQYLPDANLQPSNGIYLINSNITSAMTQHLPIYEHAGILIRFAFNELMQQGTAQVYIVRGDTTNDYPTFYFRMSYGSGDTPTFTPWSTLQDINVLFNSHKFVTTGIHVQSGNYATVLPDADSQPNNTIYLINGSVASTMTQNLPDYGNGGLLIRFAYDADNGQGTVQLYIERTSTIYVVPRIFVRFSYGNGNVGTFTPWLEIGDVNKYKEILTHKTAAIFKKVVACGDSYTSGWINNVSTNEDYAWPAYMSKITGQNWINCGHSGSTVLTWQTNSRGLPAAIAAGVSQAYVIGLMINDIAHVPLGTPSDIGTQAQTYYGGLSQIVVALHNISPNAKIFIQTCPRETSSFQPYNQAVRDIVSYYANTMHTHLLDLYAYMDLYDVPSITGDASLGHYTAIGYQQFAENLDYIMSDYINTHISAFQDVYSLPTS